MPCEVSAKDPRVIKELGKIYLEVQKWARFPRGCCWDASKKIQQETGLAMVEGGAFLLDIPRRNERGYYFQREPHTWCEDADKTKVDLVAWQFNNGLYQPIQPGVLIVDSNSSLYDRYLLESISKPSVLSSRSSTDFS